MLHSCLESCFLEIIVLGAAPPKEGGYVTAHLIQRGFGTKLFRFENIRNAINVPPRVKRYLIPVVGKLKAIFASSTMTDDEKGKAARQKARQSVIRAIHPATTYHRSQSFKC